ncbi:hypothetical protein MRB56_05080 [Halomonas cupida]|uniref:hypothetical protein n=2 Tax=Halomonas cupida TaxID=44933 RepID=UPI0009375D2A|nr:hypothetical protein [Halomonas cupida]
MAAQESAAVGHQADARPHHTSRSEHLRQCGADDNQIDQDELFDCHVNSRLVYTDVAHRSAGLDSRPHDQSLGPMLYDQREASGKGHVAVKTAVHGGGSKGDRMPRP